ncbi:MAG: hypothetical protein WC329_01590 [Candidatus Omnitrophota bacterium]|jgi:hypothetical protein
MTINGKVVYCDCHGTEKLAEINGDRIVVKDRRHGEHHIAVIPLREVLDYLPDQALIDKLQNRGYSLVKEDTQSGGGRIIPGVAIAGTSR